MKSIRLFLITITLALNQLAAHAAGDPITVAVFDFETTEDLRDMGSKISAVISASLCAEPHLETVERAEIEKVIGEHEFGKFGTITPETATKIGHLVGAQVLVTGRAFKSDRDLVLVAKIIGTDTGRMYGEVVRGAAGRPWTELANQLARKIADTASGRADMMIATSPQTTAQRIARLRDSLMDTKRPSVLVDIAERHVNGAKADPAAATELGMILQQCGFTVIDERSTEKPQLLLRGAAFSEYGMRKGNLVSCKGRIELKLSDVESGKIIAIDRQTSVAVDLSEHIAAKTAVQLAALELAERIVPQAARTQ